MASFTLAFYHRTSPLLPHLLQPRARRRVLDFIFLHFRRQHLFAIAARIYHYHYRLCLRFRRLPLYSTGPARSLVIIPRLSP